MRRLRLGPLFRIIAVAALLAVIWLGIRLYTRDYTVATEDNGLAIARVITARLDGAAQLRVARLSGVVQATGADSRLGGLLKSSRVVKTPYEVGYFVDLGALDRGDFAYDAEARTLIVTVPPITVDRPNIDASKVTLDETSGLFVTRDAMAALQQRVAASAAATAAAEARTPAQLERAQAYGRRAIARLFGTTLEAAGLPTRVTVRFVGEIEEDYVPSDRSRSLEEIIARTGRAAS